MGSGIACHLANVGIDVLMLDIVPKDLEKDKNRNVVADESLARVVKSKPNPIYNKEFLKRIKTGNFDDDFDSKFKEKFTGWKI